MLVCTVRGEHAEIVNLHIRPQEGKMFGKSAKPKMITWDGQWY
jgi:hypothetical protein